VVSMDVSIDNVTNLHAGLLRDSEIRLDLLNGVAHGGQALTPSTEDVGRRHYWFCMQHLTQDHGYTSVEINELGLGVCAQALRPQQRAVL